MIYIHIYTQHGQCISMIPVWALPGHVIIRRSHAHHMHRTPLSHIQAAAEATSAAPTESLSAATYSGAGSAEMERRIRRGVALASFARTFKHKKVFVYLQKMDALQFCHGFHLLPGSLRKISTTCTYIGHAYKMPGLFNHLRFLVYLFSTPVLFHSSVFIQGTWGKIFIDVSQMSTVLLFSSISPDF